MLSNGMYYDPTQSGQGIDLYIISRPTRTQFAGGLKLGSVPGHYNNPIWLSVQGDVDPNALEWSLPLIEVRNAVLGQTNKAELVQVGTLHMTMKNEADSFIARITITGDGQPVFSPGVQPPVVTAVLNCRKLI